MLIACAAAFLHAWAGVCAWRMQAQLRVVAALAIALHSLALVGQLWIDGSLRIGLAEALSLFAWQSALLLWLFNLREPVQIQGVVVYPLAGVFVLLPLLLPDPAPTVAIGDPRVALHVLLSLLSAGLLTLAAVHAVMLAIQDRMLHRHLLTPANQRFPPLQSMERMLFELIGTGFVLLTLTLSSGLWFIQDWMAQHLAHKTVLSISAWIIFGVLLFGRWRYGWRGRRAIRWTLSGYAVLILAYFGSKLVLELLLGEQWRSLG